ncbi:MAG: class I SAM-dependent methyltransferase [Alphaproteobacteria bacterium]|nr:class I SAM-dependent methyltransferase [Alphaproteobacteria bacterium]
MAMERKGFLKEAYDADTEEKRQDLYRRWAKSYDAELTGDYSYVAPLRTAELFHRHQPDTDIEILEVGAGTGLAGQALHDLGYRVIDAVDVIQEMLDEAAKKGIYRSLTVADIRAPLDFPARSYDAMVSVGTFSINEILPDHLLPLMGLVKPGGLLCFTVNEIVFDDRDYRGFFDRLAADGTAETLEIRYDDYIQATETRAYICVLKVA